MFKKVFIPFTVAVLSVSAFVTQPSYSEESHEVLNKIYRKFTVTKNDGAYTTTKPQRFKEEYVNGQKYLVNEPEKLETNYSPYYEINYELRNTNKKTVNVSINIRGKYIVKRSIVLGSNYASDQTYSNPAESGAENIILSPKQVYHGTAKIYTDISDSGEYKRDMFHTIGWQDFSTLDEKSCYIELK